MQIASCNSNVTHECWRQCHVDDFIMVTIDKDVGCKIIVLTFLDYCCLMVFKIGHQHKRSPTSVINIVTLKRFQAYTVYDILYIIYCIWYKQCVLHIDKHYPSKDFKRLRTHKKQLKKASAYGHKGIQKCEIYWNVDVQILPWTIIVQNYPLYHSLPHLIVGVQPHTIWIMSKYSQESRP